MRQMSSSPVRPRYSVLLGLSWIVLASSSCRQTPPEPESVKREPEPAPVAAPVTPTPAPMATAEATANYVNRHINRELGIPGKRGKRYSWGYPACPDLEDHKILFQLLPQAESELGMALTESFQFIPEQSTAAIVVHHPDAKYYSVGNLDRVAQILGEG